MCGIVGILAQRSATPLLLEALERLEYRGYDSAGLASNLNGKLQCRRAVGKLERLREEVAANPLEGNNGLGHTRWATHGAVTLENAHPHTSERVAVVHNGILENHVDLRAQLQRDGVSFSSETDTEIIVKLMDAQLETGAQPLEALRATCAQLRGSFALAMLLRDHPDSILLAHHGAAMVVGQGADEAYAASDAFALLPLTDNFCYLHEGDYALLTREGVTITDANGAVLEREWRKIAATHENIDKGNYRHFMAKEIFEQPEVVAATLNAYVDGGKTTFPNLPVEADSIAKIDIIACGTAHLAGMVAKYWMEDIARIPVEVDISSEFRYRKPVFTDNALALFISQSGETADTLAALRHCKQNNRPNISIVNAPDSTIARQTDALLPTLAGREISVASTKAFTCQLAVLAAFAIHLARCKGTINDQIQTAFITELSQAPGIMRKCFKLEDDIRRIARTIVDARQTLYIGRGSNYPLALEGALKLKETSYLDGEGYAAGELKHGPIALIDGKVALVAIAPSDELFDKTLANIQEVSARGGHVILLTDAAGAEKARGLASTILELPHASPLQAPLLYAIPLQLLAYHCALLRGTDVDQPRNLAKSVTVE
ncbi:MAG: glutamine--fructose-6-phosphate transaminase (isomerizing) [Hyphomicrobiales bacterium]|nr:glutamine--fructose-6-phosphate transaminase (isomerizing) [Hyphomicrobiales bacterium]